MMAQAYDEFIESKRIVVESVGLDVPADSLNPMLFAWQRDIVSWALKRGRAALFEDCGLGKTPQQLEWAHRIHEATGQNVLILAPLAVAKQTQREGEKFGIDANVCATQDDVVPGINITNYEKLHHFEADSFSGLVLDESSILKSFNGTTRKAITAFTESIPYRLACTATPAPNDLIELTNHAEFLNVMGGKEIIALFFKQDGNTTHKWRLKGHAREAFWRWLAEWSVAIRKPSDIGHDDGKFELPPINMHQITTEGKPADGELFTVEAHTLLERRQARRDSMAERVSMCADLVNESDEQWLVWCDLNAESEALAKAIGVAVEIQGKHSQEYKENAMLGFSDRQHRVLVTKPSIAGFGMNWQNCHNVAFVGLSDSYEQFYQAIRRCWRFGQEREVNCYIITADTEGAVVANISRKEKQAQEMFDEIVRRMAIYEAVNKRQRRDEMVYSVQKAEGEGWQLWQGDSCEVIKDIESDSVGLTVFSPPFPGMYAYTNSPRDIGNVKDITQLVDHFSYMMPELLRITMPGRCCCVHLTQEPVFKAHDGYVGLRDFRGRIIEHMQDADWIYYGEACIDKNPMLKASRTKEHTLLFKTLSKDSSGVRPAMADYMLIFRKKGDNPVPITAGTHPRWNPDGGWISADEWCEWASPVWYRAMPKVVNPESNAPEQANYPSRHQTTDGILETDVLSTRAAKDTDDEKHLCPLQLGVIERCVKLWSAPGDTVFSPFAGIGSEGYKALELGRKFVGIELKESYWRVATENLKAAVLKRKEDQGELF